MCQEALVINFRGVVQGVGFRPFVFRIAREMGVKGWVNNTPEGVSIHAEGSGLEDFIQRLLQNLPPLAKVTACTWTAAEFQGCADFRIVPSSPSAQAETLISPDVSTCAECLRDIQEPANRRHKYPFANCTNCGPRYTIILDRPYDRQNTTMAEFTLCPECESEYHNPLDRRFHAQPVACAACGPKAVLCDENGRELPGLGQAELQQGRIIAVKSLGGFHLACSARDAAAVERLRQRKHRESKPFALMARNIDIVKAFCYLNELETDLLQSPAAPIVVLKTRGALNRLGLDPALAPNLDTLGVMLPYTPLHHLLLSDNPDLLVMTSANLSGEPLITGNETALTRLKGVADYWLMHDREIYHPCDDSVLRVINGNPVFFRRARGYVPLPLDLARTVEPVLGAGGDLKNTFCLLKGNQAFISQHGGDLSNYDSFRQFGRSVPSFQRVVNCVPSLVAYDLHPAYHSSRFARDLDLPGLAVQHHHAHLASCLAENFVDGKVLGVICDGTGYGTDGRIWGFEFLWGDSTGFERAGHLEYLPLPGGDASTKSPARIAFAYLCALFGTDLIQYLKYLPSLSPQEAALLEQQVRRSFNTFATSSCGRLFDAVSALAGCCSSVNYEGQAAVELEAAIDPCEKESYPFDLETSEAGLTVRVKPMFAAMLADLATGAAKGKIAAKFHHTVVQIILGALQPLSLKYHTRQIALSGGVFQNKYLVEYLVPRLQGAGFTVYQQALLPPGDGGLCLGQAVIASEVMQNVSGDTRQSNQRI